MIIFRDIAVIYPNGYGQIVGRIKDLVIRGGENLYPREIEEVLVRHPSVAEAYVVGVPDERFGEELCAWIKLKPDTNADKINVDDIKAYCKGQLAHFKVPKYAIFVNEFPTTVTGKVQKFIMREESIIKLKIQE
jgi:fatty-acyl-CoA synthase